MTSTTTDTKNNDSKLNSIRESLLTSGEAELRLDTTYADEVGKQLGDFCRALGLEEEIYTNKIVMTENKKGLIVYLMTETKAKENKHAKEKK